MRWCVCSAQPAVTVSMRQDWVLRATQQTFSGHGINLYIIKAFFIRKDLKQLRFDEGKEQSCGQCQFLQSPVSQPVQL